MWQLLDPCPVASLGPPTSAASRVDQQTPPTAETRMLPTFVTTFPRHFRVFCGSKWVKFRVVGSCKVALRLESHMPAQSRNRRCKSQPAPPYNTYKQCSKYYRTRVNCQAVPSLIQRKSRLAVVSVVSLADHPALAPHRANPAPVVLTHAPLSDQRLPI